MGANVGRCRANMAHLRQSRPYSNRLNPPRNPSVGTAATPWASFARPFIFVILTQNPLKQERVVGVNCPVILKIFPVDAGGRNYCMIVHPGRYLPLCLSKIDRFVLRIQYVNIRKADYCTIVHPGRYLPFCPPKVDRFVPHILRVNFGESGNLGSIYPSARRKLTDLYCECSM